MTWDVIVVGAGMAGLPVAIRAAERDARVLLIEELAEIGGKLPRSAGQISAAGARLQRGRGIADSPDDHYREIMAINGGTGDPDIIRLSVEEAGPTIDWLEDIGCRFGPEMPVLTYNHDVYRVRRYFWPIDHGKEILAAFRREVDRQVSRGTLVVWTETEMTGIERDPSGAVRGVLVRRHDGREEVAAGGNVVLAAGGYTDDIALAAELTPHVRFYSQPIPISSGRALRIARDLGCRIDGGDQYLCVGPAVLDDPANPASARMTLKSVPQDRPPWEIWVNTEGRRFTREDHPKANHRRRAMMAQPDQRFFVVFDEGVRQNAPNPTSLPADELLGAFGRHPSYLRGDTVADLARAMAVDPAALAETIADYNTAVERQDDPFGRDSLPRPLDRPPFYAIAAVAMGLPSPAGIAVDKELRALDVAGAPIPNLYAVGEIIGYTRHMGAAYEAGMGNGPTIALGKVLGERFLHW